MACNHRLPFTAFTALLTILLAGCVSSPQQPVVAVNNDAGLAIKGYDAVAYFLDGEARAGDPAITANAQGATYRFTSVAHRDAFIANPQQYQPQFGGYCAYAMSINRIADISPTAWSIVDGRLFLNKNAIAHTLWSADKTENIAVAETNWQQFQKQNFDVALPVTDSVNASSSDTKSSH